MIPLAIEIRDSHAGDRAELERLYPAAFPEENLLGLLRDLLEAPAGVISLSALRDARLVGHVALSLCDVGAVPGRVALLGPLAVDPPVQRHGIGRALITAARERAGAQGVSKICVLGDPGYYGRHGFTAERAVLPPWPLPPEWDGAWQSLDTGGGETVSAGTVPAGTLAVPPHWAHRAYWTP